MGFHDSRLGFIRAERRRGDVRRWEHPKRYPNPKGTHLTCIQYTIQPSRLVWPSVIDDDDTLHDVKITAAPSVAAPVVGGKIYFPIFCALVSS